MEITFRLDIADYELLRRKADEESLGVSSFVGQIILKFLRDLRDSETSQRECVKEKHK